MNQKPQIMQLKVNPDDLEERICHVCEAKVFVPIFKLREVSAIQSPTAQEGLASFPAGFACLMCKTPASQPSRSNNDGLGEGEGDEQD